MLGTHRRDLKESHAETIRQMERMIVLLSDEVDYLRHLLDQKAYIRPSTPAANPSGLVPAEPGQKLWLSEEEEDILALRLNDYLDDSDLRDLESLTGAPIRLAPELEPDE